MLGLEEGIRSGSEEQKNEGFPIRGLLLSVREGVKSCTTGFQDQVFRTRCLDLNVKNHVFVSIQSVLTSMLSPALEKLSQPDVFFIVYQPRLQGSFCVLQLKVGPFSSKPW